MKKKKLTAEEKKAARLAKKEAKKAKKEAKRAKKNNTVLYVPEKMQGFRFSVPLGYLLRFFAIAFSLFGVLWLFCDAFLLEEVAAIPLLLFCFGAVTAFSLIFIGKWFILAGIGIIGAYIGGFVILVGNPLTFFVSGVGEVINRVMDRLADSGFASLGEVSFPFFGGLNYAVSRQQTLTYGGIFALATVLALIFAAFSVRRTRLIPMLITGGGLCAFCFTYNLCETNWGIACVLAGLCSTAVLAAYDKTYKEHKHSKKSRAYSGYSSALAGILALAILLVPAANMTEPWGEIDFIAGPMDDARLILTTFLMGGDPENNEMNTLSEERSNELKEVPYDNTVLFKVQSYTKRAVYLRSWIAKDFSYESNTWLQLTEEDDAAMRTQLKFENRDFVGDQIAYDRYTLIDQRLSEESLAENRYVRDPARGYSAGYIDVEYVGNTGQLFVLPSTYVSTMGLFEFESTDRYREDFSQYADGMYTSDWFNLSKQYTAAAVLPDYMSYDYSEVSVATLRYLELLFEYISASKTATLVPSAQIQDFRRALDAEGLTQFDTEVLNHYLSLTPGNRAQWYERYVHLYNEYTEYVLQNYLQVPEDMIGIEQIYAELKEALAAAENDHDKIMTVINYLTENYAYTRTPTVSEEREYANDLDYFLLEGKEGYCVQFATAATLLLRKAGYATRYVQGYIADNFKTTKDSEGVMNYTSEVTDKNAHAWIEVYVEGLGWRTYETTPVYYESLYYIEDEDVNPGVITTPPVTSGSNLPITTAPIALPEVTTTTGGSDQDETERTPIDLTQIGKLLIVLVIALVLLLLIIRRIRKANKIVDGRNYYVDRAEYGSFEEKSDFDQVAGVICDSIYEVHHILGNRPKQGEQPSEFAHRIDSEPINDSAAAQRMHNRLVMLPYSLSEMTVLIQKQEFGRAMNRTELAKLGTYLRALIASEYPRLPFWKKLWYRYIRFMV